MYCALSNTVIFYVWGFFIVGLLFHYPIAIGWEKAFTVKTKWDCIFAARHPDVQDVIDEIGQKDVKGFEVKSPVNEINGEVVSDYDASSTL